MLNGIHFDPFNAVLILIAIGTGYRAYVSTQSKLKTDTDWHTEWIKRHDEECDQRDRSYTALLGELQKSNAHLTTLTEGHTQRLGRIENTLDKR
jgi:hypothetical protein